MKRVRSLYIGFLVVALIIGVSDKVSRTSVSGNFGSGNKMGSQIVAYIWGKTASIKGFPGDYGLPF